MSTPPDEPDNRDTPVVPPLPGLFDDDDEDTPTRPSASSLRVPCPVCAGMRVVSANGVDEYGHPVVRHVKCGACRGSGERPATRVDEPPPSSDPPPRAAE